MSDTSMPDVVDVEAGMVAKSSVSDAAFFKRRSSSDNTSSANNVQAGLCILMKDLSYHVASNSQRGERAYLLKGVSAYLEPGQMTALMGPSGSGKTTLLDLLAGRKTVGKTEGHLSFGGSQPTKQFLRRYTGYVEQFDTLLGDLTVREMLMYTAELKRPMEEPLADKRREVEVLLQRLALSNCSDVKIGDPMSKGISAVQRFHFVSLPYLLIGIALISNPRVLFLDEPTSGLDSYTANEVMKVVRGLAADGTTIAATIHSPTAATFALFDRVMLLVRGQLVYFGPQGLPALQFAAAEWPSSTAASELLELHRRATVQQTATGGDGGVAAAGRVKGREVAVAALAFNDAEVLVETVTEADQRGDAASLAAAYDKSALRKVSGPAPIHQAASSSSLPDQVAKELATRSETVTPWFWGLWTLIKYRTSHNYCNPAWLGPRIGDKLLISLIILTLYLGVGDNMAPDNLVNVQSSLFMWALLPAFGAASYVPAIVLERRLFVRERSDGLYRVFTYLAAKLVEELLLSLIITLAFSAYVFYGVQLQGSWVVFWLVYFVDLSVGIVLAYLVAALSPNMDVANAALPGFVVTLLFFAGQLMTVDSIPDWWQWYSRIDFLRYAWGALMLNQFEDHNVEFAGGKTILEYYGLLGADKWTYVGYLSLFWIVFATLALLALTFVRHQKR
ncbi:hypothetical protein VOLCADRAFT_107413 [Volvox carteri f. nagariensis]|uniref:ABC transporter domain-containing protein n=1 Tax=Volvox carteri f. nagariensis TaxID=3068 RepID=D8UDV8_VOLCA|nr:uncharacterized protein VOLCADRAFT_107413 [Volvox carteri f. nagariensis]EFJ42159.1 hypothetical protein VOLCADRAFT_107413 [Volvox carteri f. nagariensis]|eukprot:XP_002956856.1 hypothetical protein VOLCADRAFT_107413 [Volvox carteri f. nagariensis]